MDHDYIEEHGLIDLYHRGQLPPRDEARFEEHFVGCAECQERLEMARGFQRGLKTMVAEEVVQASLLSWLARRKGLALGALLLVAGLPVLGYLAASREPETIGDGGWRQRYESAQRNAADLRGKLEESERLRREERVARVESTPKPEEPRPAPSPLVNTPVFLLTAVRSEGETVVIDPGNSGGGGYFSLAVDAGDDPRFESYRVTITGARSFREAGLKPNALEALLLTFPADYFPPGEYRLVVEGFTPDGAASELGGYPFRVRPLR